MWGQLGTEGRAPKVRERGQQLADVSNRRVSEGGAGALEGTAMSPLEALPDSGKQVYKASHHRTL